jgi:hypothetical protein
MVMSLGVPTDAGKFLVVAQLAISQEGLGSIELISHTVLESLRNSEPGAS